MMMEKHSTKRLKLQLLPIEDKILTVTSKPFIQQSNIQAVSSFNGSDYFSNIILPKYIKLS